MDNCSTYDVIIAGGGPAGASAAIHLATRGALVLLLEQKKFPRPKLCGEFISPECAMHFERLGVAESMFAAGPAQLTDTVFYARSGKSVQVPSSWFQTNGVALGLSRAEMDEQLLRRAANAGAEVIEEAHVTNVLVDDQRVSGLMVKHENREATYRGHIIIDATGRSRTVARRLSNQTRRERAPMVAFKAHLDNTGVAPGACEIYFYRGGYGGLSSIESGLSNLCFIASARDVRRHGAHAERVMREVVCQNQRAAFTLQHARLQSPWLAVSLEGFGRNSVAPVKGLLAVGDAASFIDPFTGSGMLMALESGGLAADAISDYLQAASTVRSLDALRLVYARRYLEIFDSRLRLCAWLRRAAFVPGVAAAAINLAGANEVVRRKLARATRGRRNETSAAVIR